MSKIAKRNVKAASLKMEACGTVCEPVSPATLESTPTASKKKEVFDASFWPGRRLMLSNCNGQTIIHIREYVAMGDKEYPTKNGACFTPGRLSVLQGKIDEIDMMLLQQEVNASYNVTVGGGEPLYMSHLGAGIFASISEKYHGVSLRRHWMPEGQQTIVPTKNGIYVPANQWAALKFKVYELIAT